MLRVRHISACVCSLFAMQCCARRCILTGCYCSRACRAQVDDTSSKMTEATKMMKKMLKRKDRGKLCCICILSIVLIILMYLVFM